MNARRRLVPTILALSLVVAGGLLQPTRAAAQGRPGTRPGGLPVVLEGELEVLYEDDDVNGRLLHFLHSDNRRIPLRFQDGGAPDVPSGSRIRVSGNLADGEILDTSVTTIAVSASRTLGPQNVLVILFNFSNNATQPFTPGSIATINDQATDFYLENTYGQTFMTFDVAGWFTIAATNTTCDYYTWASQAEAAASSAGINLDAYDRRVFAFPRASSCSWSGVGNVGGPRSWINGYYTLRVVTHEQGHNFGDHHSRAIRCDSSSCTTVEYGDDRDVLGASGVVGHMNAFQKERLGWLNYGTSPVIQTVTTSGDYWIENYETIAGASKALKIWNPNTGTYYYVESRARMGFDGNVAAGVTIHTGSPTTGYGHQVDLAPQTTTWDSTLDVGQTFTDQALGVFITTLSSGVDGALVRVDFGQVSCTRNSPGVSLSPASQAGPAGSALNFTATVTNNDGQGCATAPFTLAATPPSGWSYSFSSLPSLAPGASATVNLSMSVPAGAAGTYPFGVTALNSASASVGSASGSVTAAASLDMAASASLSGGRGNRAVTVAVTVRMGATAVPGAAVLVTIQPPSGGATTVSATTGADGRASVRYSVKRSDPPGTYQVQAVATLNGITGSTTTSVNVQ